MPFGILPQWELGQRQQQTQPRNLGGTRSTIAPTGGGGAPADPNYGDISSLFREALAGLTGETEKMYQSGKRRTLSDIAMQSVNAGMANTLNMPAAGIAYDEANRAQTNLGLATQRANILTGLGQTAAGIYGTNVGAQTSRYATDVGASTSRYGIDVGAQTDAANRDLQIYLANLNKKYGGGGGGLNYLSQPSV